MEAHHHQAASQAPSRDGCDSAEATATNQVPNASAVAMAYFKDAPKSLILASAQGVLVLQMLVRATGIEPARVAADAGSMATNETRKGRASAADE
jgi:hypothetical protein